MKSVSFGRFVAAILIVFFCGTTARAQQHGVGSQDLRMPSAETAIYLELLGNGLIYSINLDHYITPQTSIRLGFGYIGVEGKAGGIDGPPSDSTVSASLTIIPLTFNYFIGGNNNRGKMSASKLELGLGLAYVNVGVSLFGTGASGHIIGETAVVGYRLQPSDGGFVFRIGFTPVILDGYFLPWGGLSLGAAF